MLDAHTLLALRSRRFRLSPASPRPPACFPSCDPLRLSGLSQTAVRSPGGARERDDDEITFDSIMNALQDLPTPEDTYSFGLGLGFKFDAEPPVTSPMTAENMTGVLSPDRGAVPRLDNGTLPIFNMSSAGHLSPGTTAAATNVMAFSTPAASGCTAGVWSTFMARQGGEDSGNQDLSWQLINSCRSSLLVSADTAFDSDECCASMVGATHRGGGRPACRPCPFVGQSRGK